MCEHFSFAAKETMQQRYSYVYFRSFSKVQFVALRTSRTPNGWSRHCFSLKGPWRVAPYLALISSQTYSVLKFLLKCQLEPLQRGLAVRIALTLHLE